ncbi:MAG: aldo/keto reductase [Spirochaetota bacterium]
MEYCNFGNTGLMVSRLSLGAMTFGEGTLVGELKTTIDQKTANEMVEEALAAGVNLFDTADMYTTGQSEIVLGKALQGKRQDALIATKCGFRSGEAILRSGLSYRYIIQSAEASLQRLGTDCIDLYQLHIPDPWTPVKESARALEDLQRQGKIRYSGICNYPAWQTQRLLDLQEGKGWSKSISSQMYYSLLGRDIEEEVIPCLQANQTALMVWSPLASGFLTGKYSKEKPVPEDSRRAKFDFPPVNLETGYQLVDKLQEIGSGHNKSLASTALAWLLSKSVVSTVILGANKMSQLQDNLTAATYRLSPQEVQELDKLSSSSPSYPTWMQAMGHDSQVVEGLSEI